MGLTASTAGFCEEWTIQGVIAQQMQYTDNVLLAPRKKESAFGSITAPKVTITRRTPDSEWSGTAEARANHFFGHSELDGVEPRFVLRGSEVGLRATWGGSIGYTRELTRRAELTDTGILGQHGWRVTYQTSPGIQFQLTPRDTVSLNANYTKRDYHQIQLIGYQAYSSALEWDHASTPRLTWLASLNGTYYESNDILSSRVKVFGGQAGVMYMVSDALTARLTGGATYVSGKADRPFGFFNFRPPQGSSVGALFSGSLKYAREDRTIDFSIDRSVNPSGFGTTLQSDTVRADLKQRLGAHLWVEMLAYYQRSQQSTDRGGFKRNFYSAGPNLRWQFSQNWNVIGEYRYRNQEYSSTGGSRASNTVNVTVRYGLGEYPLEP